MENFIRVTALKSAYIASHFFQNISPEVTGRLACFLWFTPLRKTEHRNRESLVTSSRSEKITASGQSITLRHWGDNNKGPRYVLIHGWGGRWDQFSELISFLVEKDMKVTSLDFPAHGESTGMSTHIFEWLKILSEVQKTFDEDPIYICHSFGLVPVSYGILDSSLRAQSIMAVNSPTRFAFLMDQFMKKVNLNPKIIPHLERNISRVIRSGEEVATVPLEKLASRLPVLFVVDKNDREVPFKEQLKAQEIFQENFVTFEGHGHNRILRAPEFLEIVNRMGEIKPSTQDSTSELVAP